MSGISPVVILLVVWGAITAVFVVLMIYRSLLAMREEDQIFLDPAEAKQEAQQREIVTRVERLTTYVKGFGFASLSLLLVTSVLWVYQVWKTSGNI